MPKKKNDEPEQSAEEQAMVQRVDTMMSTELPKEKVSKLETTTKPPIVIALADETKPGPDPAPEVGPDIDDGIAQGSEPQTEPVQADNLLEDSDTDEAVDEIVANESDTMLAVSDALSARKQKLLSSGRKHGGPIKHKWIWLLVFVVLLGTAIDFLLFASG